jgi:hypothetical protein
MWQWLYKQAIRLPSHVQRTYHAVPLRALAQQPTVLLLKQLNAHHFKFSLRQKPLQKNGHQKVPDFSNKT